MNYQECRAYIDDSAKYGSVLGLDNMREMLDRLGNPQNAVPYVHVAGTNGKGSVIAYLYTTLTRAGYKVGRYISPTLYSYRERLEIAGEKISQEDFAKYVTEISRSILRLRPQQRFYILRKKIVIWSFWRPEWAVIWMLPIL